MPHVIGRGRYARETYPQRVVAPSSASNVLRWYGGGAEDSVPAVDYLALRFVVGYLNIPDTVLAADGYSIQPTAYTIRQLIITRHLVGAGAEGGDAPISFQLIQTLDSGATITPIGTAITYEPGEAGVKSANQNIVVPLGAVLGLQASFPANYTISNLVEYTHFVATLP